MTNLELHLNINSNHSINIMELINILEKNKIQGYIVEPEFTFENTCNYNIDLEFSEMKKIVNEFKKAGFQTISSTPFRRL